jgi:hypothetical protein
MKVVIEDVVVVNNKSLKYKFTLRFTDLGMKIFNCALFDNGNRQWFSFPQRATKNSAGQFKYFSLVEVSESVKKELEVFVKDFFSKYVPPTVEAPTNAPDFDF